MATLPTAHSGLASMNSKHNKGFTLIEMMVTVAVLAIILGIGVPSFQGLIERNRVSTATDRLLATLASARSEAIRLGQAVNVLRLGDTWQNGWEVTTGASTIRRESGVSPSIKIIDQNIGNAISFAANGNVPTLSGRSAVFTICATNSTARRRQISINERGHLSTRQNDETGCGD